MRNTGSADHDTAVTIVETAVHAAWRSAAANLGFKGAAAAGLLLRPTVCITGCVLLLGQIVGDMWGRKMDLGEGQPAGEGEGEPPAAPAVEGEPAAAPAAAVGTDGNDDANDLVAFVDGAWTVPLGWRYSSGSHSSGGGGSGKGCMGHIHLMYEDISELKRSLEEGMLEGELEAVFGAPEAAGAGAAAGAGGAAAAAAAAGGAAAEGALVGVAEEGAGAGAAMCCGPVIARWGEEVRLRVVEVHGGSSSGNSSVGSGVSSAGVGGGGEGSGVSSSSIPYESSSGDMRDVVQGESPAGGSSSSSSGGAGGGSSSSSGDVLRVVMTHHNQVLCDSNQQLVRSNAGEVAAAAAGAVGGGRGGSSTSYLQLRMPTTTTSSSSGIASSSIDGAGAAAAVNIAFLPPHPASVTSHLGNPGTDGAPLGYATVLLLPAAVADELVRCAEQQQLRVGQLNPLLQDVAFVLDAREILLQVTSGSRVSLFSSPEVSPGAESAGYTTAISAVVCSEDIPELASKAAAAAGNLLEFLEGEELLVTADFVAILRQQLLLASLRANPLETRRAPLMGEAAGPAGLTAAAAAAETGSTAAGAAAGAGGGGRSLNVRGTNHEGGVKASHCSSPPTHDDIAASGGKTSSSSSSSSSGAKGGGKPQSAAAAAGRCTAGPPADIVVTAQEQAAVTGGALHAAAVSRRGSSDRGTEARYSMFYASYVKVADWAARVCITAVVSMMMVKYAEAMEIPLGAWESLFGRWGVLGLAWA